jgi:ethanolamine permease
MSVLGALVMYIVSMLALFRLRKSEPTMARPFRAPLYPLLPIWTLIAAGICLASLIYYNRLIAMLFAGLLVVGYLGLRLGWSNRKKRESRSRVMQER